ncbi:VPLPA-CTERM sorting domain-containing protein [Hyphococcus lacteus]|uniref:VPLPA-CTERM sorting domain-containing protein n=1 Tax=Hyphococcus lacteus TaxID=3143536 RepID=A0ABV3Z3G9_9PROT
MTYQILLDGEGFSNGKAISISGSGSFIWDADEEVNFNDHCSLNCGSLPTLSLVQSIDFSITDLGVGLNSLGKDALGLFSENYGYLYFNGSSLFGFCLSAFNPVFDRGCEQSVGSDADGQYSNTRTIFEGDAKTGAPFQFNLAGNDWGFSGTEASAFNGTASGSVEITAVPIPAALPLFLSALFGIGVFRRFNAKILRR